jgi:hypothetical protein
MTIRDLSKPKADDINATEVDGEGFNIHVLVYVLLFG